MNGAVSKLIELHHGVPQGSILGPLLFLVMINDLHCRRAAILYADDTTLRSFGQTPEEALMEVSVAYNEACDWFKSNKFLLNEGKTQSLVFTLKRGYPSENVNLLGFVLDSKLRWADHIDFVCKKLSRVIYLLGRLRKLLPESFLRSMYFALFHSHLNYGLLAWGHAARVRDVLLLQKKALRVMLRKKPVESARPLFQKLRVLTVYSQYIYNGLLFVHSNRNSFAGEGSSQVYATRGSDKLPIPFSRFASSINAFPMRHMRMYNELPPDLRKLPTGSFGRALKAVLLGSPLYSLQEWSIVGFRQLLDGHDFNNKKIIKSLEGVCPALC